MDDVTTNFADVGAFHKKFNLPYVDADDGCCPGPYPVTRDLIDFRVRFLMEELTEFMTGVDRGNIVEMADALVDLVYVALGTAHLLGLPWQDLWDEVQQSNMAKERASSADVSSRKSAWDVIKPEGWEPPNLVSVLRKHGWWE